MPVALSGFFAGLERGRWGRERATVDLLRGNIKQTYFRYLGAAFGSAMLAAVYSLVDMAMVGQYQGPDGAAALAVVAPVWNILYSLGMLTGMGGSVLYSAYRGQGRVREANRVFTVALGTTVVIACLVWAGLVVWEVPLIRLFGGEGELAGHSLGNLFLAALIKEFGNPQNALEAASKVLNIRGQVIPATPERVRLVAKMSDGVSVEGESEISEYPQKAGKKVRIEKLSTIPDDPIAVGDALQAIKQADLITLGPGSLYTSVLPNLLVPEILQAIRESSAPVLYICNVMTQPGETTGFTVSDHLQAIIDHVGPGFVNFVLANNGTPRPEVLAQYAKVHAYPVRIDRAKVNDLGAVLIEADLLGIEKGAAQDNDVLANKIVQIHNLLKANIPPDALESYLRRSH